MIIKNNSTPLVSVFMPAYNQEDLISESIESIINQTYTNWELIIGDDCSSDSTYTIALAYQDKFPEKIKVFRNEVNLGITDNCNQVLKHCTGKYIAFTAGDDLYISRKLEEQVALMESSQDCILSYHDVEVFDSETKNIIRYWNSGKSSTKPVVGCTDKLSKELVLSGTAFMAAVSVMVKKSVIPASGFDRRIPVASDWLMWIEICTQSTGKVMFLDKVLARYRKHNRSITYLTKNEITDQMVTLALVEARYFWLRDYVRKKRGCEYYRQGVELILENKAKEGRRQLYIGAKIYLCSWKVVAWWIYSFIK